MSGKKAVLMVAAVVIIVLVIIGYLFMNPSTPRPANPSEWNFKPGIEGSLISEVELPVKGRLSDLLLHYLRKEGSAAVLVEIEEPLIPDFSRIPVPSGCSVKGYFADGTYFKAKTISVLYGNISVGDEIILFTSFQEILSNRTFLYMNSVYPLIPGKSYVIFIFPATFIPSVWVTYDCGEGPQKTMGVTPIPYTQLLGRNFTAYTTAITNMWLVGKDGRLYNLFYGTPENIGSIDQDYAKIRRDWMWMEYKNTHIPLVTEPGTLQGMEDLIKELKTS